jgi:hypothetical protein
MEEQLPFSRREHMFFLSADMLSNGLFASLSPPLIGTGVNIDTGEYGGLGSR